MNVEIKWENLDGQKWFNDKLIDLAKKYAKSSELSKFNFQITLEPNSRHIINLKINTNKDNQTIDIQSNSHNLENSFYLLNRELDKKIKAFDPNASEKALLRQEKINEQIRLNREKALQAEKKKLQEQELKKKEKLSSEEREKQKKLQKQNEEILKKLEKNRKEYEKEDEKIISELEQQKKELEEANRIKKENQEKLERHMETLKFEVIDEDIEEDKEIQEKIKEDKEKLKELQSEENECLVIIEEIKELDKQDFDIDRYKYNEPFALADYWFYFDEGRNFYIATSEGSWAPIDYGEVLNYYQLSKYNKFQELEARLIEARKRRKLHLKDLVDGSDLLKELEQSKHRHKQLEKQQKENFKKLKENYEASSKQTQEELKTHIKPVEIEIAEVHPANEPFLTNYNMWAYHDGEGRYYLCDETGNWTEVSKSDIYEKSKLFDSQEHKNEHKAGDMFKNMKNEDIYFDGETYYKIENDVWVPCSLADALDLDYKKEQEEKNKKKLFGKKNEEPKQENKTVNIFEAESTNNQQTSTYDANQYQQVYEDQNYQTTGSAQQWTDENGTTWYLDESGNYFWWDGNNWVPYTYQ